MIFKPQRESAAPLDVRLARILVAPLEGGPVHPNHLTAVSLAFGLLAAALFAFGEPDMAGWAAFTYMLAVFTDHTDGELARKTGKSSQFGHTFDFLVGGLNYALLFAAIGYGLWRQSGEAWPLWLGLAAAAANPVIMSLRMSMENRFGFAAVDHPQVGLFTIEDFIYLIGPITWLAGIRWFFLPYSLGTFAYLLWTLWEYRAWDHKHR